MFRFHFLLGADWRLCCRQLKIDRGNFFHTIYRIEQKLGHIFAELEPYPLYPLNEYFAGVIRKELRSSMIFGTDAGEDAEVPAASPRNPAAAAGGGGKTGIHPACPLTMVSPASAMDPLTHTATGLFLSRIGLNRWTPRATPILLLAANAPDLDILTASGGSLNYLHYHGT